MFTGVCGGVRRSRWYNVCLSGLFGLGKKGYVFHFRLVINYIMF